MNSVTEFVKTLGPARLAAMGAVAVGLIGFFIFLLLRFSQPQMGVLFTDLAFEDSVSVVKRLEGMDVPHEVRQEGAIILVPKDRMLRLRMALAEDGLPAGGAVGYEIFDNSDTLGSTSFVQNINRLRAIEGELARTIREIGRVQSARVHLVLPQRRLFAEKAADPSASIVLKVRGTLETGQIKAVQHLVASAVEGLQPGRVSIVDEAGRLLANGHGDSDGALGATLGERGRAIENRTRAEIEEIVASIVGPGRARVSVTADIDYNKITETSDIYDPDGQVVRSTQTREENSSAAANANDEGVTVGNELPAANPDANAGSERESASKTEEVVNYEISRTTKTEVIEGGRVKRLSVAVLVDGVYQKGADGKLEYAPRPDEQLEKIGELVRSAVGFDEERGDSVYVANLRFADTSLLRPAEEAEAGLIEFTKRDYFHIAEIAVIALLSLLVLIFVVRPLVRRIITPEVDASIEDLALEWQGQAQPRIASPEGGEEQALLEPPLSNAASDALRSAKIIGEVQAATLREVGEVVNNNKEEALTIVRNWLQEGEGGPAPAKAR